MTVLILSWVRCWLHFCLCFIKIEKLISKLFLVKVDGAPFKGFLITAVDSEDGKRIGKWYPLKGNFNEYIAFTWLIQSVASLCHQISFYQLNLFQNKLNFIFVDKIGTINIETCAGITHANNNLKKSANLLWIPPSNRKGSVTFV